VNTVADARAPLAARRTGAVIAAYCYALIVAGGIGYFLLAIPIQLSDCYGNMLKLHAPWRDLMAAEFTQRSYLRPLLWAELKLVYDASGGSFFAWFRGTHVAQVIGLACLYLMLVRPRNWRDAALVPLGLAVLFGIHTFRGTIVEAFPINTFLTIVLCCFAAANLAFARNRWWVDVLAILLFVVAALTVESGLLVGVIFIGAAVLGATGISRATLGVLLLLFVGYFVLRFSVLEVGAPSLVERSSGYGFRTLDPPELIARFGDNAAWFYAYNIVTSAVSVLFSEPRAGQFGMIYGLVTGAPYAPAIVNVIASTAATTCIGLYIARRWRDWRARQFNRGDQLVILFFVVLAANAAISYPYTKDVIMSPAGAFFAVAVFVAVADALSRVGAHGYAARAAVLGLTAVIGVSWALRLAAVPVSLSVTAGSVRTEWAYAEDWLNRLNIDRTEDRDLRLLKHLRDDAIYTHAPAPPVSGHWLLDVD
jgi:hypothetical protein